MNAAAPSAGERAHKESRRLAPTGSARRPMTGSTAQPEQVFDQAVLVSERRLGASNCLPCSPSGERDHARLNPAQRRGLRVDRVNRVPCARWPLAESLAILRSCSRRRPSAIDADSAQLEVKAAPIEVDPDSLPAAEFDQFAIDSSHVGDPPALVPARRAFAPATLQEEPTVGARR